jgi:hypothetical protein
MFIGAAANGLNNMVQQSRILQNALSANPSSFPGFPTTYLGVQLNQVLQIINARGSLGMKKQIFLCMPPGFDTHENQLNFIPKDTTPTNRCPWPASVSIRLVDLFVLSFVFLIQVEV